MQQFRLEFFKKQASRESELLLQRIHNGSQLERAEALNELINNAKGTNHPDDWNLVGLGLHHSGYTNQAIKVFSDLVDQVPEDIYRINLATAYSQIEQTELCKYHLTQLMSHGSTAEAREYGKAQLENYNRFLGLNDEDIKLRELQKASLRKKIRSNAHAPEHFVMLGRLLDKESRIQSDESKFIEAISVYEQGTSLYPNDVAILEHIIAAYLRYDPNNKLNETLQKLESLDPNSSFLDILHNLDDSDFDAFQQKNQQREAELLQLAASDDAKLKESALKDLRHMMTFFPQNPQYKLSYAFALSIAGKYNEALKEANELAAKPANSHPFHFNLGQTFWFCGEKDKARQHLKRAQELASNEQEIKDVEERLTYFESL